MQDYGFWSDGQNDYMFFIDSDRIMLFPSKSIGDIVFPKDRDHHYINLVGRPGIRGSVKYYSAFIKTATYLDSGAYELRPRYLFSS